MKWAVFILWMIFTLILTFSIIGMMLFLCGTDRRSTWMELGYDLLQKCIK